MDQLAKIVAIGAVLIALVASATGWGVSTCQRRQLARQATAITAHRAGATQADTRAQRAADSALFFRLGQQYELQRRLDENAHHGEALPPVVLPAHPPKEH